MDYQAENDSAHLTSWYSPGDGNIETWSYVASDLYRVVFRFDFMGWLTRTSEVSTRMYSLSKRVNVKLPCITKYAILHIVVSFMWSG